jgi:hypothetical protein
MLGAALPRGRLTPALGALLLADTATAAAAAAATTAALPRTTDFFVKASAEPAEEEAFDDDFFVPRPFAATRAGFRDDEDAAAVEDSTRACDEGAANCEDSARPLAKLMISAVQLSASMGSFSIHATRSLEAAFRSAAESIAVTDAQTSRALCPKV